MQKLSFAAVAAALLLSNNIVLAGAPQGVGQGVGNGAGIPRAPAAASQPAMTDAEVRTINKDAGKITLKHGEIKNLDMGAMTMVFQVKEPALLDKVKEGDKVQFTAERIRGQYTVTAIEKK